MKIVSSFGVLSVVCLSTATVLAASGDHYLYAPRQLDGEISSVSRSEGVLVKEITIHRGDTLRKISRAHGGRASYYPQILLFNEISNPDLIYAGKTLRVPVQKLAASAGEVAPKADVHKPRKKSGPTGKALKKKSAAPAVTNAAAPAEGREEEASRLLYEKGVKAYRSGNCSEALPLLEKYLAKYPQSSNAPDAALFRADCHMKLAEE